MNVELSRRIGKLMSTPFITHLSFDQYMSIGHVVESAKDFADLPVWLKHAVIAAEKQPSNIPTTE
jgi:hypothetical protein